MKYFREDLHRRLLSADFKKQVDGIEMLQKVFFLQDLIFGFVVCEWVTDFSCFNISGTFIN